MLGVRARLGQGIEVGNLQIRRGWSVNLLGCRFVGMPIAE